MGQGKPDAKFSNVDHMLLPPLKTDYFIIIIIIIIVFTFSITVAHPPWYS